MEILTCEPLEHGALSQGDGVLRQLHGRHLLPPAPACAPGAHAESEEASVQKRRLLLRNLRMVTVGLALGLTSHVIYLFILSMLPYEQSGGARLSDRLITLLSGG